MLPAVSQICSLGSSFEDDLNGYADAAAPAVELWLTKLEEHLKTHSIDDVLSLAAKRELKFVAAAYQGGVLLSQGDARREAWNQFDARLDLCARLNVPVLIVVADFHGLFTDADIKRAQVSLKQAGVAAGKRGVKVALEFQAKATFLNNLETAASFVQSVADDNVGLCLDVFHFSIGPSKLEDLAYLTRENLFHVQVSDVADRPRELASDADRIFPGDGDFHLQPIFQRLRDIGYAGHVSLELPNPMFWQVPARQVGEIGMTALRVALGQAQR